MYTLTACINITKTNHNISPDNFTDFDESQHFSSYDYGSINEHFGWFLNRRCENNFLGNRKLFKFFVF